MSQNNVNYSGNPTGPQLLDNYLTPEQTNILSCNSGIQRPSYAIAGTRWLDISVSPWALKLYDGSSDVTLGTVNPSTHVFTPSGYIDNRTLVHKTGNEDIGGIKTLTGSSFKINTNISASSGAKIEYGLPTSTSVSYFNQYINDVDQCVFETKNLNNEVAKPLIIDLAGGLDGAIRIMNIYNQGAKGITMLANHNTQNPNISIQAKGGIELYTVNSPIELNTNSTQEVHVHSPNTTTSTSSTEVPTCGWINSKEYLREIIKNTDNSEGCVKLSGGRLLQWGYVSRNTDVTFAQPYTQTPCVICSVSWDQNSYAAMGKNVTTTSFTASCNSTIYGIAWFAIGY